MELKDISMYQACLLHSKAERVLKSLVSRQLEQWDVTRMEWLLLATVMSPTKRPEGHTMGDVAELLDVRLSQLTALVSKMSVAGLVVQEVSSTDRRTKYLKISTRGERFLDDIEAEMRGAMRTWLSGIPHDRLKEYMLTVKQLGDEQK